MLEIGTSGSMSGEGKRGVAEWPKLPRLSSTLPTARRYEIPLPPSSRNRQRRYPGSLRMPALVAIPDKRKSVFRDDNGNRKRRRRAPSPPVAANAICAHLRLRQAAGAPLIFTGEIVER